MSIRKPLLTLVLPLALSSVPATLSAASGALDITVAETPEAVDSGIGMMSPVLRCSDAERSLRFYTQGLGMVEMGRVELKDVTEIILGFSNDRTRPGIMLIKDKPASPTPAIELGNGYQRTVLRVADLRAVADRLAAAGYPTGAIANSGPYRILMIEDPDGYRYELVEFPPAKQTEHG
jgi:catechol 2,3-dioxygenase-like lactoylglutathione lyase family enzyme